MLAQDYPVRIVCRALGCPLSSFYYRPMRVDEAALSQDLERLAGEWPPYGSRRLAAMLRREGYPVGRKRVARLMQEKGLCARRPARRKRTTNSNHSFRRYPNLVEDLSITRPDQVWVADITYVRLGEGFVYLAVLMDVFTRSVRGWNLSRHLDGELTRKALERALKHHQPEIHHSDQGVQYADTRYVKLLLEREVQISMATVGEPTENGYAERLMRTIKEEHVDLTEYQSFADAYFQIGQFLEEVYQKKRIHSSLGYLTPEEFEGNWQD
jgi:transposase InsO family protein